MQPQKTYKIALAIKGTRSQIWIQNFIFVKIFNYQKSMFLKILIRTKLYALSVLIENILFT